jgi:hypothetical protein
MQHLTLWDLLLSPIYLLVLSAIARKMRDIRYPPGHALRRYFMPGLYVKFFGAVFIALIYQYYYGGGDTFNYFNHTKIINSALSDSFVTWFKLVTRQSVESNPELYQYASQMEWYYDPASYTVPALASVFSLVCGTNYIPIALCFAFFPSREYGPCTEPLSIYIPKYIKNSPLHSCLFQALSYGVPPFLKTPFVCSGWDGFAIPPLEFL